MKLFIDGKNRRFVKSAASNVALDRIIFKRRDYLPLEIVFVDAGAVVATPAGTGITVALKQSFADYNFLAIYENGVMNLNTTTLEAAFASNPASLAAYLEVRWTNTGEATRTATLQAEIQNSVILGGEGTPAAIPELKASQAQAQAGTDNERWMTPLRTFQSIAAWIAANLSWSTLTGKPSTFPPSAHTHATSDVTGLDTALAGKAAASHTHTASQITDFAAAVSAAAPPTTNASLLTSGTLPDARLSAGVATSLGKADSALQAAALIPYRTAAAQDIIDAGKQPAGSYATTTALNSAISGLASVYTTTAAVASQITAYGYQTAAQVSSAISSALTSYATTASVSTALAAKLNLSESSYIIAKPGDDLAAKYTAAKTLTPNGAAKSATNRASLVILPGRYTLTAELAIDAECVDVIGLGAQTHSPSVLVTGATLNVSADDCKISGISVASQVFKVTGNKPLQVWENCTGGSGSFSPASGNYTGLSMASGTFPTLTAPTTNRSASMRNCLDASGDIIEAFLRGSTLASGLQAFYKLSDLSDSSGNNRTLTNNGSVTFASGKIGNAAVFNGSNWLENENINLYGATQASFSAWLKTSSQTSGQKNMFGRWGGSVQPNSDQFLFTTSGDGQTLEILLQLSDGSGLLNEFGGGPVGPVITDGQWHNVIVVFSANSLKLFWDGLLFCSKSMSNASIAGASFGAFQIADAVYKGFGSTPFDGQIDAVGIWNRALSDAEVAELYNNGTGLELP